MMIKEEMKKEGEDAVADDHDGPTTTFHHQLYSLESLLQPGVTKQHPWTLPLLPLT